MTVDDLLRERDVGKPLTRLAVLDNGGRSRRKCCSAGRAASAGGHCARVDTTAWRLELNSEDGSVRVDFDEVGRALLALEQATTK